MAANYKYDGDNVPVVAPYNVNSGDGVKVGNLFGVAMTQRANSSTVAIATRGVFMLKKPNAVSTSIAQGGNVHWDDTNRQCTVSATSNLKIGVATVTAGNTDTVVEVRLSGAW